MIKVLVVGQTPPPYHGQAMMIERLVGADLAGVEISHVRLAFSASIDEIGRVRVSKVLHLVSVIGRIWWSRFVHRTSILYYPPAGARLVPMIRDAAILIPTRWLFDKVIFHFHAGGLGELYPELNRWQRWLFERAYFAADGAITISELAPPDGEVVKSRERFVIPNGIPDPWPRGPVPRSVDRGSPLEILYIGILREEKGVLVLLEACEGLRDEGVPFNLSIVGAAADPEFSKALSDRIERTNLGGQVHLLGPLIGDAKWRAFERAEVLCHPSWYDTMPLVILEGMAAGLAVVSTEHSGIPTIVDRDVTGLLVEPGDAGALRRALMRLATERELTAQMGLAGRRRFEQEFSESVYLDRVRAALTSVAGSEAAGSSAS